MSTVLSAMVNAGTERHKEATTQCVFSSVMVFAVTVNSMQALSTSHTHKVHFHLGRNAGCVDQSDRTAAQGSGEDRAKVDLILGESKCKRVRSKGVKMNNA